jgi:TetR/AcrR family transcriptional regulator, mexJK operon transcriptional repressor
MRKNNGPPRRGAGRPTAADAEKVADRLLDAAQELFVERGFASTTMDEIARRAGSSTQTIYSRYGGKAEMLRAVVLRLGARSGNPAEAPPDPKGADPRVFLISRGQRVVRLFTQGIAGLNRLAFAEAYHHPELRVIITHGYGRGVELLQRALETWKEDGSLKVDGDPHLIASLCMSMLTDRPRIRAVLGDPMSDEEADAHVRQAVDIFLHGCSGPRPKRGK